MADIVDITKYKAQRKDKTIVSEVSEEKLANKILDSLNFNNRNIAIPIVKIAKSCGLGVYRVCFPTEEINTAGKLFTGGNTESLYGCNQVILVNRNDHLFDQRIVIARMLGCYLIDMNHKNCYKNLNFLSSDTLDYRKMYDKYEEFILNILAPNKIFVRQYAIAINEGLLHHRLYMHLSKCFEVSDEFVLRKIRALTK